MNRAASSVIHDVDVVLFMIQSLKWTDDDELVLKKLKQAEVPVVLIINKVDIVNDKDKLLPFISEVSKKHNFSNVIPISAKQGDNVQRLEDYLFTLMPEAPAFFKNDEYTDRSTRFLVAEIIREKLVRELGNELPYQTTVEIERYKDEEKITRIHALILVETKGQKVIVIGDKGARLKSIGTKARKDIEALIDRKVFLQLWVKVKSGWSDSETSLRSLGYDSD